MALLCLLHNTAALHAVNVVSAFHSLHGLQSVHGFDVEGCGELVGSYNRPSVSTFFLIFIFHLYILIRRTRREAPGRGHPARPCT